MVTKTKKTSADDMAAPDLSDAVKDSAHQIWLAGLGAYAKAQEEGSKVFDALVKEGQAIQRKTQAAAEEKISEATNRMADLASDFSARATGKWDKLENMFEDGVARALNRMGVAAPRDVAALRTRIDELTEMVQKMSLKPAKAPAATKAAPKKAASSAKRAAARKSV